ncbi:MAG: hypothetical protein M1826_000782 [Phylliscum demangeonii]|nr:MAG: hypothetical protein M1826_000782 [Phylliscum demangeonii]
MAEINPDDFNSSDLEFTPPPDPYPNAGKKSIESIIAGRLEDRITSKKRVRGLTDSGGAPTEVYRRGLWMKRFDAFCEGCMLTTEGPPPMETVLRFANTIVRHITPKAIDKAVPSAMTIRQGLSIVLQGLEWRHAGFEPSRQDIRRLDTVLDALRKEGLVTLGQSRPNQWVGLAVLSKLGRSWIQAAIDHGCISWDVQIARLLSIALMSALNCRSGEVARSAGYTGEEFLAWEDVELSWDGDFAEPNVDRLVARVTLRFEQGRKKAPNVDRVAIVEPFQSAELHAICPIKLLLVHALRHGAVRGANSLDEVWAAAKQRQDRCVVWARPSEPVMPSISVQRQAFLDFGKPAGVQQIINSVQKMASSAGVLTALVAHDVRLFRRAQGKLPARPLKSPWLDGPPSKVTDPREVPARRSPQVLLPSAPSTVNRRAPNPAIVASGNTASTDWYGPPNPDAMQDGPPTKMTDRRAAPARRSARPTTKTTPPAAKRAADVAETDWYGLPDPGAMEEGPPRKMSSVTRSRRSARRGVPSSRPETKPTRPRANRASDAADREETDPGEGSEVGSGSEDEAEVAAARWLLDDVDDDSPDQAAQLDQAMEMLLDGAWTADAAVPPSSSGAVPLPPDALASPTGASHRP